MQEARPGLLSHGIDEQDEPQALHDPGQAEARQPGQQAGEDDARGAQGKGQDFHLAQQMPGQDDGKQKKYGVVQEFHARTFECLVDQKLAPQTPSFR